MYRISISRAILCALPLVFSLATAHNLPAQTAERPSEAERLLKKYEQFVTALQESRFEYRGTYTLSPPRRGLTVQSSRSGTVALSVAHQCFHEVNATSTTIVDSAGSKRVDNDACETLAIPARQLSVSSSLRAPGSPLTIPSHVDFYRTRPDNWRTELRRSLAGLLLGYLPKLRDAAGDIENGSLIAHCRKAQLGMVRDREILAKGQTGFVATSDELTVRVLFAADGNNALQQIELTRPEGKIGQYDFAEAVLVIENLQESDGRPTSFTLKSVSRSNEGQTPISELPDNIVLTPEERAAGIHTVPSMTLRMELAISNVTYQETRESPWFELTQEIPNGTLVNIDGGISESHYWENGEVKRGEPPTPDSELQRIIQASFTRPGTPSERLETARLKAGSQRQHLLILLGDPTDPLVLQTVRAFEDDPELQTPREEFVIRMASIANDQFPAAQAMCRELKVPLSKSAGPLLLALDTDRKLLGQHLLSDLSTKDGTAIDATRLTAFLKGHAPKPLDARQLLADALKQARQEGKQVLFQQTAPWCDLCAMLAKMLETYRARWEKDYVWVRIDERWTHAEEVINSLRKNQDSGIPWLAVLNADGTLIATTEEPYGVGKRAPANAASEEPPSFFQIFRTTAQHLTEQDLAEFEETLQKLVDGE